MKRSLGLFILILTLFFLSSNGMPQGGDPDTGADLYVQKCARCHGSSGEGGSGPSHRGCSLCNSFESLFAKINEEMPSDNPQDCTDACAYDTAAFIFVNLNGHSLKDDSGGGCLISLSTD